MSRQIDELVGVAVDALEAIMTNVDGLSIGHVVKIADALKRYTDTLKDRLQRERELVAKLPRIHEPET